MIDGYVGSILHRDLARVRTACVSGRVKRSEVETLLYLRRIFEKSSLAFLCVLALCGLVPLIAGAKEAPAKTQSRKEDLRRKGQKIFFGLPLRPWRALCET